VIFLQILVFYPIAFLNMAPHMGDWQHAFIEILLAAGASKRVCARQADCSLKAIQRIRKKMRLHGKTRLGREYMSRRVLSNEIIIALICRLDKAPNLYLDKIMWFIYNQFQLVVTRQTLSAELRVAGWSRKLVRKLLRAHIRKLLIIYKAR